MLVHSRVALVLGANFSHWNISRFCRVQVLVSPRNRPDFTEEMIYRMCIKMIDFMYEHNIESMNTDRFTSRLKKRKELSSI